MNSELNHRQHFPFITADTSTLITHHIYSLLAFPITPKKNL